MDRYFYLIEMDGDRKVIHLSGNVYFNDADETITDHRCAEWTGLCITLAELKELIDDMDVFWEYINERVAYLADLTKEQATVMCQEYFNGTPGTELDIRFVNEDTPCGDYWFE